MIQNLTYKYYHKQECKSVYIVLHGGGKEGIETNFISNIFNALIVDTQCSVFAFNFPYCSRGEEVSSGPELKEEINTLKKVLDFLKKEGYTKINIVAKSLGGIVASHWIEQTSPKDIKLYILGYVLGSIKTNVLQDILYGVIQGEYDRFGNAMAVVEELKKNKYYLC